MGLFELIVIGVGLSMDAFAVSICKGLSMPKLKLSKAFLLAFSFGLFQALMPVVGYLLGSSFAIYIEPVDHWIAFVLLSIIGAKMIYDAFHEQEDESEDFSRISIKELLALSIATSIDALAVGISFALLSVDIVQAAVAIGVITFCLSLVGVFIGHIFGAKFEKQALILGGIVLVLIGLKILLEHLGFISL